MYDKSVAKPVAGSINTTGGTYQLTEGGTATTAGVPKKETYNTDSGDRTFPFYCAGFSGDRTADSTTLYDEPTAAVDKVEEAFGDGARSVISRAHFSTYLVKEEKVAYQSYIDVEWSFADATEVDTPPKGQHTVSGSGAATSLPKSISERFQEQYPAYKHIK